MKRRKEQKERRRLKRRARMKKARDESVSLICCTVEIRKTV